jgi:hypothetical protein
MPEQKDASLESQFTAILEKLVDAKLPALVEQKLRSADDWLTVKQAMEISNLSEWTIRKIARQGKVKVYQPNPGKPPLRISRNSLQKYLAA